MRANLFWLNDEQWAKIKPLIPTNRPGQKPRNNRWILSGIIHVLKTGCRSQDCPPEYGPYTTVYNRFNRWSGRGIWQQIFETVAGSPEPPEQVALDSTHVKAHRGAGGGKGGASEQAIGVTKGGRNSKLHALVDKLCRPWVIILTPGNVADCADIDDGPEHNTLQSEAGYIDARPQSRQIDENLLRRTAGPYNGSDSVAPTTSPVRLCGRCSPVSGPMPAAGSRQPWANRRPTAVQQK
jgi:transposase